MVAEGPSGPILTAPSRGRGLTPCTGGRGATRPQVLAPRHAGSPLDARTMPSVPGTQLQTLCLGGLPCPDPLEYHPHGHGKSWILKQNDPDHKSGHPLLIL